MNAPKPCEGEPLLVLLVEDNLDHAELVKRNLLDKNVANRITHVTDGQDAMNYLFRRGAFADPSSSPRPHLVLLDLRLPRVDGTEVLRAIKQDQHLKRIPVVVLTTSDAERDVAMAYDCHANSYLVKPLDFSTFVQLMKDLGYYWLAWNVHPRL